MSIEKAIEEKIRKAIEVGDFDDLEGRGKPLDLTAYFNTPENMRLAFSMLKSNEFVPEEVEMLKEIAFLKEQIAGCSNDDERSALTGSSTSETLHWRLQSKNINGKR